MINLGTYSLSGAVLASALGVLLAVAAGVLEKPSLLGPARWMLAMVAALITSASAALLQALVQSDFTIAYVASYTERALPLGYKLAAFWAGQAGSLLFWTWALSLMALVAAFAHKRRTAGEHAAMLGTLAAVGLFFCTLMLFAVNPFDPTPIVVRDGNGLNPLLQNPAMIAHPPILFLGYAGFTIPFALLIGALVADRRDAGWMIQARRWLLGSWLFLTVGILLGAWWAYVELGWGGYWAWDPVENASLLPWLTATAVLHSIMIQQQRGMFRIWNAAFIAATFLLCVFATYLTRSGIVQSVHSFGQSPIGWFFLSFLVLGVLVVAGLMIARRRTLAGDRPLESVVNREGAFLAGNVLFLSLRGSTPPNCQRRSCRRFPEAVPLLHCWMAYL